MRYAARTDSTQTAIVEALRAAGCSVWPIKLPCDLLVGVAGKTAIVECKVMRGKLNPKPSAYTKLQRDFMMDWKGGPVATITDVQGALRLVATLRGAA